jgi:hypothetical protein
MNRADRKRWASCRTLADLGGVTAGWLHGEVEQTPSHLGPPCAETKALIPVLAAVNRAGYVTDDSQPGVPLHRGSGQRAAVSGFAGDGMRLALREMADATGLLVTSWRSSAVRTRYACRVVVTARDGHPFTGYGAQESRADLHWMYGEDCHPGAVEALCAAWQVCVIDPEFGRNDALWPALEKLATGIPAGARGKAVVLDP